MLIAQIGRSTPGAQAVVTELLRRWQDEIAAGVRHMQAAGEIDPDLTRSGPRPRSWPACRAGC